MPQGETAAPAPPYTPPAFAVADEQGLTQLSFARRVRGREDLGPWQQAARQKLEELLNLPEPARLTAPEYEVLHDFAGPGYQGQKIAFACFDGQTVLAYLLLPRPLAGGLPGILALPGHGLGARSTVGLVESRDGQMSMAAVLASQGYAVMAPELRSFGEREIGGYRDPAGRKTHEVFGNFMLSLGRPLLGLTLAEAIQAFLILAGHQAVDRRRLGVAGLSQGGRLAHLLAALRPEARACLVASGLASSLIYDRGYSDPHDEVPGLLRYFDYPDLAGLVAPRPLLLSWGLREWGPYWWEARENTTYQYLRSIYALADAPENLDLDIHPGAHAYHPEGVLRFFAKAL